MSLLEVRAAKERRERRRGLGDVMKGATSLNWAYRVMNHQREFGKPLKCLEAFGCCRSLIARWQVRTLRDVFLHYLGACLQHCCSLCCVYSILVLCTVYAMLL